LKNSVKQMQPELDGPLRGPINPGLVMGKALKAPAFSKAVPAFREYKPSLRSAIQFFSLAECLFIPKLF
jgi:hypothetical protein